MKKTHVRVLNLIVLLVLAVGYFTYRHYYGPAAQVQPDSESVIAAERFPAEEVFYVVPLDGMSIAVRKNKQDGTYRVSDTVIDAIFVDGEVKVYWGDAEIPGYEQNWSVWIAQNSQTGILLE